MDLVSNFRLLNWSLRKLRLGIGPRDLVLDVGSGGNPHPRADVLLERYTDGFHRHGDLAVADRPIVFADAGAMPFKDKAFDFIIAFHVLEHMRHPEKFLSELARVGKAGYIETPNVVFERFVPYDVHLLEIMDLDGRLYIQKKARRATDSFMDHLALNQKSPSWKRAVYGNPELFHVRFFWKNTISFEIVNPEENCDWFIDAPPTPDEAPVATSPALRDWRSRGLGALRKFQTLRRPNLARLDEILACPTCHGNLATRGTFLTCDNCRTRFPAHPYPNFTEALPL